MKETDQIGAFAVAFVILGVLIGIGYALFVIPGLILTTIWIYALPLVVDRGLGVGDAMSESRTWPPRRATSSRFSTWLVGALVVGIIVSVLNVIPVIGLIVGAAGRAVRAGLRAQHVLPGQRRGPSHRRGHRAGFGSPRCGRLRPWTSAKLFRDAWGLFVKDIGPLIVGILIASLVPAVAAMVILFVTIGGSYQRAGD